MEEKKKPETKPKRNNIYQSQKNIEALRKSALGNQWRLKWTEESVTELLIESIDFLNNNVEVKTLVRLAEKMGVWTGWFLQQKQKFNKNKEIVQLVDRIYTIIESRLLNSALNNQTNSAVSIFALKSYHERIEKQYIQTDNKNNNSGEININIKRINKEDKK